MSRYKVAKHPTGQWAVYQDSCWYDTFPTHREAITWANRYAVGDFIFGGGLSELDCGIICR